MSFFVCNPWTTELHEMKNALQMLNYLFSHDCKDVASDVGVNLCNVKVV